MKTKEIKKGNKYQIREIKRLFRGVLKKYGVKKAALFGSVIRGEDTDKSDIDLLIEFEGEKSLLDLVGLKLDLEELVGKKVDVITYKSIHPLLREKILSKQERIL